MGESAKISRQRMELAKQVMDLLEINLPGDPDEHCEVLMLAIHASTHQDYFKRLLVTAS